MKIYIAGPISDDPNYKSRFAKAEEELGSLGHIVLNPAKNQGFEYKEYLDMGLNELMRCEAIYLLDGWEYSSGAMLEYHYACCVGMKILTERGNTVASTM